MYRRPSKRVQSIRRAMTYVFMTASVLVLVAAIILFVQGYRLNGGNNLEQGALLQFDSQPNSAVVTVDGRLVSGRSPNKSTVFAGMHTVVMTKEGYQPWTKTIDVKAGTLTWLDYGLLIPVELSVAKVAAYPELADVLTAEDDETILLQPVASQPSFEMVDLRREQPTITTVAIPADIYSEPVTPNVTHTFTLDEFDASGRYVLVQHRYNENIEWIVLDTQEPTRSENVTTSLDIAMSQLHFAGTSGNILYALSEGTVRKLDLSAETLSRPLITNVKNFDLYETNILSYVGTDPSNANRHVAGVYQDGDDRPVVVRSTSEDKPLQIAVTHYFNNDYIAVSLGNSVQVLKGFPHDASDVEDLELLTTLMMPTESTESLGFSPTGVYVLAQASGAFMSYDIEQGTTASGTIDNAAGEALRWLDQATLYSDASDSLMTREFDGANVHTINPAAIGFEATLSPNSRYLYSIDQLDNGQYQLQRVTLLLN